MTFYTASGLENFEQVRIASDFLKEMGHKQSYDWTKHGDVRALGDERMREVAENEVTAVMNADFVLVLLPGARGTHTEIGLSIASAVMGKKKKIWLWSENGEHFSHDERSCTFYFHPEIKRIESGFEELLTKLKKEFSDVI